MVWHRLCFFAGLKQKHWQELRNWLHDLSGLQYEPSEGESAKDAIMNGASRAFGQVRLHS